MSAPSALCPALQAYADSVFLFSNAELWRARGLGDANSAMARALVGALWPMGGDAGSGVSRLHDLVSECTAGGPLSGDLLPWPRGPAARCVAADGVCVVVGVGGGGGGGRMRLCKGRVARARPQDACLQATSPHGTAATTALRCSVIAHLHLLRCCIISSLACLTRVNQAQGGACTSLYRRR